MITVSSDTDTWSWRLERLPKNHKQKVYTYICHVSTLCHCVNFEILRMYMYLPVVITRGWCGWWEGGGGVVQQIYSTEIDGD